MTSQRQRQHRHISWNGLFLEVPASWQVSPNDLRHLNVEADFQAVMELRWQALQKESFKESLSSAVEQYRSLSGLELTPHRIPESIEKRMSGFDSGCYRVKNRDGFEIVFLHHRDSSTFIIVQCYPGLSRDIFWQTLGSLGYSPPPRTSSLWSIQDFQVRIPDGYSMTHYKMDAGFTVLCFRQKRSLLHVLRLAPADVRLRKSSIEQICATLLGVAEPGRLEVDENGGRVEYASSPGIISQIRSRLGKRNPFHRARFWHDAVHNRLLGIFMEGTAPIDEDTFESLCAEYEILPNRP